MAQSYLKELLEKGVPVEAYTKIKDQTAGATGIILEGPPHQGHLRIDHHATTEGVEITPQVLDNILTNFPQLTWMLSCCATLTANLLQLLSSQTGSKTEVSFLNVNPHIPIEKMDLDQMISWHLLALYLETGNINQVLTVFEKMIEELFAQEFFIFPQKSKDAVTKVQTLPDVSLVQLYQARPGLAPLLLMATPHKDLNYGPTHPWQNTTEAIVRRYGISAAHTLTLHQPRLGRTDGRNLIQYSGGKLVLGATGVWQLTDIESVQRLIALASQYPKILVSILSFARNWIDNHHLEDQVTLVLAPGARNLFARIQLVPIDSTQPPTDFESYVAVTKDMVNDWIISQNMGDPVIEATARDLVTHPNAQTSILSKN